MNILIASNRPFPNRQAINPIVLDAWIKVTKPYAIFFPFWSWKVPNKILKKYKCIGFHTGAVAGGSPIQNLILLGKEYASLNMFYMTDKLDKGKVICSDVVLLTGSLEEIVIRMTKVMEKMIKWYLNELKQTKSKRKL
jgi:methionyl-tRNA formyltransferase